MFQIIACIFLLIPFIFISIYYFIGLINIFKVKKPSTEVRLDKKILKLRREIDKVGNK